MKAADIAIDRTLRLQRLGEAPGGVAPTPSCRTTAPNVSGASMTSARRLRDGPFRDRHLAGGWDSDGLTPPHLLLAGARFQAAADFVDDRALQPELAAVADRLFETGLSRLSEARRGEG